MISQVLKGTNFRYKLQRGWTLKLLSEEAGQKRADMYTVLLHLHVLSGKGKFTKSESILMDEIRKQWANCSWEWGGLLFGVMKMF